MEYKKIKRGVILYWDDEPVRVDSKTIDPHYGETIHITRFAAKDKKQNGYASVSPGCLSLNPITA